MLPWPLPESNGIGAADSVSNRPSFIEEVLLLDLEARSGRIYAIGAVLKGKTFEIQGKFNVKDTLADLDRFARDAKGLLGHNVLDHDLPILKALAPGLSLLRLPVIDTLFLSPLAFPENPYHRLVKDYKLVKDSVSDPVSDARLARSVFLDQWESFSKLAREHEAILSFYRFSFEAQSPLSSQGIASVFTALGASPLSPSQAIEIFERYTLDRVCRSAFLQFIPPAIEDSTDRPALAYILAWLRVAGTNSVLPPWVRRRFPSVEHLLARLRSTPCSESGCAYCEKTFRPEGQLKRYFGFATFRASPATPDGTSLQEAIVSAGMENRPHLAILPTGGGKSLCYQIPALSSYARLGALTVVLSPLQALMKDQVDNLSYKTGTPYAAAINGLLTPPERGEVLERVRLGDIALLYVAPEQLRNRSFREAIAQRAIGAWVFDEAHCLSKWGHDFRPDYLYAGRFIREFSQKERVPIAPVSCFTATAKRDVQAEIIAYFKHELDQDLELFEGSVERENLHFEVRAVRRMEKYTAIEELLSERVSKHLRGSAIVYTATRRRAEEIAEHLSKRGFRCGAFHGGLNAAEKRTVQEAFLSGSLQVIAATNAFGMGIDKGDVRLVLHVDIPGSLESYLQEAGRAGRDLADAECVLLYDEGDLETQFKLGSLSRLSQKDIAQILRGLRKTSRSRSGEIVLTAGELLRDDAVETSFDLEDLQAETKVKTAIAWLERAHFLERNENQTRVFQGKLLVKSLEEAKERISRLNLSKTQEHTWLAILSALINSKADEGLDADRLAELAGVPERKEEGEHDSSESASQHVLRILHGMTEAGLLQKGILLTAYVRHKVKTPSRQILQEVSELEEEMLKILREEAPDAAELGWAPLSLRVLNQRLKALRHETNPEVLRGLLKSLSLDGRGLAGSKGSLALRHLHQDKFQVKLLRSWEALIETSRKRRAIAKILLDAILAAIPPETPPSAELLVSFSVDELSKALQSHLFFSQLKDPLAAIDRALLFLHEQKAILLQHGLAIFRQAMSIRILPEAKKRKYSKADYDPLDQHYRERIFQVHVMNEYARLGVQAISRALELVLAYFTLDKASFIRKYFPGRKETLARATGEASYQRIVEALKNPVQMEVVASPEDSNILILAGPGSGKTRAVVHRCAFLIRVLRARPESILIACFNHHAALSLRKRLFELLGEEARGVTVQTYHGMAMRLTGTSFAEMAERSGEGELPFDRLIPEAVKLLRGEKDLAGLHSDELRDRLLSSFRHILVDEYQDIDSDQYELISALAGRLEKDSEAKLSILAVGDDDQNIYTFRGANVRFIRKFQEDYEASVYPLLENYRSSGHIIEAANHLIEKNRDRMKTDHPIERNRERESDPPGGRWEGIDPVGRGRVQVFHAQDGIDQALGLLSEWQRMRTLDPKLSWSDLAVLARTRESLSIIRALCEHFGIPVAWSLSREKSPPLHRIREISLFLETLKARRQESLRASTLVALVGEPGRGEENPWVRLLDELLASWREETADAELPASYAIEWLYESMEERKREQRLGDGVYLSTVHGAKGMEFPHVFVLDGDWGKVEAEEERRLFYVAMTRAKETLSLFERADARNPYIKDLQGEYLLRRKAEPIEESPPPEVLSARYELLGLQGIDLGFAGRRPANHPIHRHLGALEPGSILAVRAAGTSLGLFDPAGHQVAALSKRAAKVWLERVCSIRSARVLGLIRRRKEDGAEAFQPRCQSERWEVPWVELIYERKG